MCIFVLKIRHEHGGRDGLIINVQSQDNEISSSKEEKGKIIRFDLHRVFANGGMPFA